METTKVLLHKSELDEINKALKKFPDVDLIEIQSATGSIGSITDIVFLHTTVNGVEGDFKINITSVDNW